MSIKDELLDDQKNADPEIKRLKKHVARLEDMLAHAGDPETDARYMKLRAENSKLKGSLRSALQLVEVERERNELILQLAKAGPNRFKLPKHKKNAGRGGTVCFWCSDWHVEEVVTLEKTDGYNEHNLERADEKIQYVTGSFLQCLDYVRHETTVNQIVVGLLGDFISGYIHEELQETNELSPTDASFWVQERIMGMLERIAKEAKVPIIVVTCFGNHGRTTRKPRIGTAAENSYEFLMYRQIERYYRNDSRFDFKITRATENIIDLNGFVVRTSHGDEYRYQSGVGGLAVPVRRGIKDKNSSVFAHLDAMGHHHTYQQIDNCCIVNSSLVGYNPYARWIRARREPPMQAMTLIHNKHGHVLTRPLFCAPHTDPAFAELFT